MEFSCLHDWLLLANVINYSRLSLLIALRNLTNPTPLIFIFVFFFKFSAPIDMPDEKRIIHELLRLYELRGIDGRPVRNSSMPVSLNFSIQLIQIMDLDEKNQILKLSVWDRYVSNTLFIFLI